MKGGKGRERLWLGVLDFFDGSVREAESLVRVAGAVHFSRWRCAIRWIPEGGRDGNALFSRVPGLVPDLQREAATNHQP